MNKIMQKLRSSRGVSMIIAMVFMLFCAFIGGSVLASATANAYRVAHLEEQQDFLLERSTALLLSDQLRLEEDESFRLHVVDAVESREGVRLLPGGGFVSTGVKLPDRRIITFTLYSTDAFVTPMQRLIVESAIHRYMQENAAGYEGAPVLRNVYHNVMDGSEVKRTEVGDMTGFWCTPSEDDAANKRVSGTISITGTADSGSAVTLPSYNANYSCGRGTEIYDFCIDFGELSQLKLRMDGFSGTNSPTTVLSPPSESAESSTGFVQITTVSTQTTISWDQPIIEKGGASK